MKYLILVGLLLSSVCHGANDPSLNRIKNWAESSISLICHQINECAADEFTPHDEKQLEITFNLGRIMTLCDVIVLCDIDEEYYHYDY